MIVAVFLISIGVIVGALASYLGEDMPDPLELF